MNYKIDSYTKLLLHMDGDDESTTFTDSSDSAHTVTRQGDAQIDTSQKKFGTGSGLFDGTGDYLTVPDHADWYFGTGDFIIDVWVRTPTNALNPLYICGQYVDDENYWRLSKADGSGSFSFYVKSGNVVKANYFSGNIFSVADAWHHIALVRNGTSVYFFLNGISQSLTASTAISTNEIPNLASVLYVGATNTSLLAQGWLDEFRLSKGIARHTANFTPPKHPYGYAGNNFFSMF